MNNRFFLGAVAALSIVSANAERLLDSADNYLVVDNEPMVFGSMVSNKAWTTAEQQTAGLGLYRFFGYTVDAKPVVLSTDFQIESAAYKNGTYYIESTANADTDAAVKLHGHLIAYEPDLDIMSEIAPITNIHNLAGSIAYNPADNSHLNVHTLVLQRHHNDGSACLRPQRPGVCPQREGRAVSP